MKKSRFGVSFAESSPLLQPLSDSALAIDRCVQPLNRGAARPLFLKGDRHRDSLTASSRAAPPHASPVGLQPRYSPRHPPDFDFDATVVSRVVDSYFLSDVKLRGETLADAPHNS